MIQLGLVPENMETIYNLAGTEEAKIKLDLLQTYIAGLPEDVQTTVTQQILLGDYVGAVATVQQHAANNPATMHIYADVSNAMNQINRRSRRSAVPGSSPTSPSAPAARRWRRRAHRRR